MMAKTVEVTVPASTANLGPGFDTLGLAFQLYLRLKVTPSEHMFITYKGIGQDEVPVDKSNLVCEMIQYVYNQAGVVMPNLHIEVNNEIPLTRGLGSSASAIIAGLIVGNELLDRPFTTDEIYQMSTAIEEHPDNVGASLFGGMVVGAWDGEHVEYVRILPPDGLCAIAVIPDFTLPTAQARQALPEQFSRKDVVHNISRSSLLVASLMSGQLDKLNVALRDCIHQPYRAALVPGMKEMIEQVSKHGAYGAVLSGAGPTLLAFCHHQQTEQVQSFMQDYFSEQPYHSVVQQMAFDLQGVRVNRYEQVNVSQ